VRPVADPSVDPETMIERRQARRLYFLHENKFSVQDNDGRAEIVSVEK